MTSMIQFLQKDLRYLDYLSNYLEALDFTTNVDDGDWSAASGAKEIQGGLAANNDEAGRGASDNGGGASNLRPPCSHPIGARAFVPRPSRSWPFIPSPNGVAPSRPLIVTID
ncbi:conserved hypothetical protein [Ricinus communis]|uniref:Uncharacterized protein n=1 Tax=Ricinus communis TaxID=3988 RepID=B9SK61_RICCO|nr:conserved hypothetical protein [Ricinus communis]